MLAQAQVNIEKLRQTQDPGWAGSISGDVLWMQGNNDLVEVGTALRIDYAQPQYDLFVLGNVRYGERSNRAYKNRSFAHARYTRRLGTSPWSIEAFGQVQNDGFRLLQLRTLQGLGPRRIHVQTDRWRIAQGTSLMLEQENLDADRVVNHPATTQSIRWNNYLYISAQLTPTVSLINTVYVQPDLGPTGDVRLLHEAALRVKLAARWTLATTFNLDYDSDPPDNIEALDLSLRHSIAFSF
ncbi:MAG: hypothetical protein RhofKO_15970 [Rhodothermales bacterium]